MGIHSIFGNWLHFAALNILNILNILLLIFWKKQPLRLSWAVVGLAMGILCLAPPVLHSSFAILILFLCYTLLPLQLCETALAALLITALALALQFINGAGFKQARLESNHFIIERIF